MKALSDSAILTAWERGRSASPTGRAMALLTEGRPTVERQDVESWPIGRRDAALLLLREATFGDAMPCRVACPACAEELEFEVRASELRIDHGDQDEDAFGHLESGDYGVRFRLPNSRDLERSATAPDALAALFEACVLEAHRGESGVAVLDLPVSVREAVSDRMSELDPQADVRFDLRCSACGHAWRPAFDIGDYLWREVAARAERVLNEVHTLALHYGWDEARILAMAPVRRHAYLELLGAI